jgi:hypothetical protein
MPTQNAHLWRQLVGRSLYSTYLEWWYDAFSATDVLLVCLEDLATQVRPWCNIERRTHSVRTHLDVGRIVDDASSSMSDASLASDAPLDA